MRKLAPWVALAAAILAALSGTAMLAIGYRSHSDARKALQGSITLHDARLELAKAQEELGKSDLNGAVEGAHNANRAALRVVHFTSRIVDLVARAENIVVGINDASRKSADTLAFTKRQTALASEVLDAIRDYQASSVTSAQTTNRALSRILDALRETNRNFEPPPKRDSGR